MSKDSVRQLVNVISLAVVLAVNALANLVPINGTMTGAVSDRHPVGFTPANYVFSIWGVIYLMLACFTIYQALPGQRENALLRRVGYLFALTCLANSVWVFLWHYEVFIGTVVVMFVLLASLIAIYLRVGAGRKPAVGAGKWLLQVPFSTYLGWITVATVANVSVALSALGWGGFGISAVTWTLIVLVVAAGIAVAVALTRRDVAYTLVIVWAFTGIAVKHSATPMLAVPAALLTVVVVLALGVARGRQPLSRGS